MEASAFSRRDSLTALNDDRIEIPRSDGEPYGATLARLIDGRIEST